MRKVYFMKRILALLLLTAFLLCGCTPYNEDETTGEIGDSPLGDLPFEGGYDPNGWT